MAEAMHAGLAVIAIAQGADVNDLFQDGVQGFRVPRSGGVQACIARLGQLAQDRDLLERLRYAAHQKGSGVAGTGDVCDAYAALLSEMFDELRSLAYQKPAPLFVDPVLGALSLAPMFQLEPDRLGFPKKA